MVLFFRSSLALRDDGVEVFVGGGFVFGVRVWVGEFLEVGLWGVGGALVGGWGGVRMRRRKRRDGEKKEVGGGTDFVETEVTTSEGCRPRCGVETRARRALGGHFLPRFVLMPFLPLLLPCHQSVNFLDRNIFIDLSHIDRTLK